MSEFRKHGRKAVRCSITISHNELGDIFAETKNISETGVFIAHRDLIHCISVGEEVAAKLYSEGDAVYDGYLRVIRLTQDGVGLEFI